jgi:adenylate cyclase
MSVAENITSVRRLAAIMAADVAGYSRLMGADEEGTLARLKAHRRELIDPKIREHRGRIVKTTGDGVLVEFASVVDAVRCAVEVQRGMLDREAAIEEDRRIRFRIGINLGDIIADGDDIFGDGVNVAARLEALADPGGICVSRTVRNQIRDKLPYAFEDMGEQTVKNIARPVRADRLTTAEIAATPLVPVQTRHLAVTRIRHRWIALVSAGLILAIGAGAAAWWLWPRLSANAPSYAPSANAPKPAPRLSIVVLPFANLSNDPEQEYFVDAVTDNLTTDLTRITGSFVIARNTAFSYKGKAVDVKQIGRDLAVRYVLEGSVHRRGEQVQINVQLIDAENGAHLWADRFDTDRTNLAKVQDEIVTRLARALRQELYEAAARRMELEKPVNPDASDFVMRGWAWYRRANTAENLLSAQRAFERALEIDPESVDARAGLAWAITEFVANARRHIVDGIEISREQDLTRAERLLREAIERDRNNIRTLLGLGRLRRLQNHLTEAKIYLEQVIALDHSETTGMLQLGIVLTFLGKPDEALLYFTNVLKLDPRYQGIFFYYFWLGDCYLLLNQPEQAIDAFRRGRAASPGAHGPAIGLAAALGLQGDADEAKRVLAEAIKIKPELNTMKQYRAQVANWDATPEFVALRQKTWDVGLRRAGLPEE